jgi:hypothetical protein
MQNKTVFLLFFWYNSASHDQRDDSEDKFNVRTAGLKVFWVGRKTPNFWLYSLFLELFLFLIYSWDL